MITQYFGYFLFAISVVLGVIFFVISGNIDPDAATTEQIQQVGPILNYYLLWAAVLVGLTAFLTLAFPIGKMIIYPKKAAKTLIMILIFAVLIFIGWSFASDELLSIPGYDGNDNEPDRLKMAGTALYATYLLLAGVLLSIIYSEVSRVLK